MNTPPVALTTLRAMAMAEPAKEHVENALTLLYTTLDDLKAAPLVIPSRQKALVADLEASVLRLRQALTFLTLEHTINRRWIYVAALFLVMLVGTGYISYASVSHADRQAFMAAAQQICSDILRPR